MRRAAMQKLLEQEFEKRADINVPFHEQAGALWDAALAAMWRAAVISKRK